MEKIMEKTMNSQGTLIGAQTHLKGDLQGDEDLNVVGRVDGTITLTKTLVVDRAGVVVADVKVTRAVISGTVVGNITAEELVHITEEGRVVGDIAAPRVVLMEGAALRGNVDMGDLEAPRPAMVASPPVRTKPSVAPAALASSAAPPRPAEPARRASPQPPPPAKRVSPRESKPFRPPRKPEKKAEPPELGRRPELGSRSESLERRAEAALAGARGGLTPRLAVPPARLPKTESPVVSAASSPRGEQSPPAKAEPPPRLPTTAGKKTKARRR